MQLFEWTSSRTAASAVFWSLPEIQGRSCKWIVEVVDFGCCGLQKIQVPVLLRRLPHILVSGLRKWTHSFVDREVCSDKIWGAVLIMQHCPYIAVCLSATIRRKHQRIGFQRKRASRGNGWFILGQQESYSVLRCSRKQLWKCAPMHKNRVQAKGMYDSPQRNAPWCICWIGALGKVALWNVGKRVCPGQRWKQTTNQTNNALITSYGGPTGFYGAR